MATTPPDDDLGIVSSEQTELFEPSYRTENIKVVKERIINTSKLLKIFKHKERELTQTKDELTNLQAELVSVKCKLKTITSQHSNVNLELDVANKELGFYKGEIDRMQKTVSSVNTVSSRLELEKQEVQKEVEKLQRELQCAKLDRERAESSLRAVEMLKQQLEAEIHVSAPSKATLEEHKKEISRLKKELQSRDSSCKNLSKELEKIKINSKQEVAKAILDEQKKAKNDHEQWQTDINSMKSKIEELLAKNEELVIERDGLNTELVMERASKELDLEDDAEKSENNISVADLSKESSQVETKHNDCPQIQALRDQLQKANDGLEREKKECNVLRLTVQSLRRELDEMKQVSPQQKVLKRKQDCHICPQRKGSEEPVSHQGEDETDLSRLGSREVNSPRLEPKVATQNITVGKETNKNLERQLMNGKNIAKDTNSKSALSTEQMPISPRKIESMLAGQVEKLQEELRISRSLISKKQTEINALNQTQKAREPISSINIKELQAQIDMLKSENEKLLKTKRVLQDTFTDQQIQIADLREALRDPKRCNVTLPEESTVTSIASSFNPPESNIPRDSTPTCNSRMNSNSLKRPSAAAAVERTLGEASRVESALDSSLIEESSKKMRGRPKRKINKIETVKQSDRRKNDIVSSLDKEDEENLVESERPEKKRKRSSPSSPQKPWWLLERKRRRKDLIGTAEVMPHEKLIKSKFAELSTSPLPVLETLDQLEQFATSKIDLFFKALEEYIRSLNVSPSIATEGSTTGNIQILSEFKKLPELAVPAGISQAEANGIWLIWGMSVVFSKSDFLESFLSWAHETIILKYSGDEDLKFVSYLTRSYITLVHATRNLQRARVFCFDLMREPVVNTHLLPLLSNVAAIWPEVLRYAELDMPIDSCVSKGHNLLIKVWNSIVAGICVDYDHNELTRQMYIPLERECGWHKPSESPYIDDIIIKEIVPILRSSDFMAQIAAQKTNPEQDPIFLDFCYNLIKSFELAALFIDDWHFVCNDIINAIVLPLGTAGALTIALEIIGVLGRRSLLELEEKTGLENVWNLIKKVLEDNETYNLVDQAQAAESLLLMANGDESHLDMLFKWYKKLDESCHHLLPKNIIKTIEWLTDTKERDN